MEGKEVHCLGDANIDFLKWKEGNGKLQPLVTQLFDRIVSQGFAQIVTGPTRAQKGQVPSGLDHYYTNCPDKIASISTFFHGGSDHRLISAFRQSKTQISKPRIIYK